MSRVGQKPISLPQEVKIDLKGDLLTVKGPKGELRRKIHPRVNILTENDQIVVSIKDGNKGSGALHGLFRALVANMVTGVTQGFEKALEIVGVGYRAELSGKRATFHLGYASPVMVDLPEGIDARVEKTKITLSGIDKELLGRTAAKIRSLREPEPYKGKGIRYEGESIRRKAGKTGATS
ncbi:MAG: 50S ribosomal protein L6 [Desulfobacteraceae bacterium]|jgi:large subunit ribosomal protein L6